MTELHAAFLAQREEWTELASCKNADPNIFILEQGYTAAEAIRYCKVCPVTEECADYARRTHSIGVWGGKLFTFRYAQPVELLPITPVQDARPRYLVKIKVGQPSILGSASFSRPSILGR